MLLGILTIFLLNLQQVLLYDFAKDFQQLNKYKCEPACWFNKSEITTDTISLFPTCIYACAIITINQNTNVPLAKLKSTFANLTALKGALRVENSTLTDLSFFSNLSDLRCELLGISIQNNSKLSDVGFLNKATFNIPDTNVRIANNPKLDASSICESAGFHDFTSGLIVSNNLKDCGCRAENIGTSKFSNCVAVFGDLRIVNVTQSATSLVQLENVKNITGNITVFNTGLQNLSFVKVFEYYRFLSDDSFMNIDLRNNPNMTRLGMKLPTDVVILGGDGAYLNMNIEKLHPDFCLTTDEMEFLVSLNTHYKNNEAVYCPFVQIAGSPKFCKIDKLSTLDPDCNKIMGNVYITSGDEGYVSKLKNVTHIFGSLKIEKTSLTNVDFLQELRQIASLNESVAIIQIIANYQLKDLCFPNLRYPYNIGSKMMVLQDNPLAFSTSTACSDLQYVVYVAIVIDGGNCMDYQLGGAILTGNDSENEAEGGNSTATDKSAMHLDVLLVFLLVVAFCIIL